MHGEEEARLVLVDSFHNENERGEMRNLRGEGQVEDPLRSMFQGRNPEINPSLSQSNQCLLVQDTDGALMDSEGLVDPAAEGGERQPMTPLTQRLSKRLLQQQLLPLATASSEIAVLYVRVTHTEYEVA